MLRHQFIKENVHHGRNEEEGQEQVAFGADQKQFQRSLFISHSFQADDSFDIVSDA